MLATLALQGARHAKHHVVRAFWRRVSTAGIERSSDFGRVTKHDVQYFQRVLGSSGVITAPEQLAVFNTDWLRKYEGSSSCVLRPRSAQQVSEILTYCNQRLLAVVPQGGNTGLVGGSVPVHDEIVLSLSLMNNVIGLDEDSGVLQCEAGCVLQTLEEHVSARGFTMPLDLGAKGSCHFGGNVSTNAGGIRLLRYGSLRGSVLGLEVVQADGGVLDLMKTLRKDNTGYDLKQLFIGAEGTLGVITKVALQCPPKPRSVQVAFAAVDSYQSVLKVLKEARSQLGEILSAFEFLDSTSVDLVEEQLGGGPPGVCSPLAQKYPFYVLLETAGSDEQHDREKLDRFTTSLMESGLLLDGVIAQDQGQAASIWHLRESVTEALTRRGGVYKYDVSIPVAQMYRLVDDMRARLATHGRGVLVAGYGHVADGNLHLNISNPEGYDPALAQKIEPYVYEWVTKYNGSVSAEHGLGLMKAQCIRYSKSEAAVAWMRQIKAMMDPRGILNPYKVLPQQRQERAE